MFDNERELRLYVKRKREQFEKENNKPHPQTFEESVESYRHIWDMLPESVRRTINVIGHNFDTSKRRKK